MVQEILYTSAEKGLKQGSRGFCTVIGTAGMAVNLAERLESMSGYRHAFPMGDPRASQNPVCFSHVTTRLAGKTLHVISRVADAGQDYSGRSNKLAHHIAIENIASLTAGPARLLRQSGVVVDRWNGEVRNVAPRDLPALPTPTEVTLAAWKSLTGDHGWAGFVAEQLTSSSAPVHVIFQIGTDVISLVQEVIDLLPASQRWNITFCTYFTRLLAGTECQLRFVLDDTPEATVLRNDARAQVIDLTKPLSIASGGGLVKKAHSGIIWPDALARESPQDFADLQATATSRTALTTSVPAPRGLPRPKLQEISGTIPPPMVSPLPAKFAQPRTFAAGWILVALVLLVVGGMAIAITLNGGGHDKFGAVLARSRGTDTLEPDPDRDGLERKAQKQRDLEKKRKDDQLANEQAERDRKAEEQRLADARAEQEALTRVAAENEKKLREEERQNALKIRGPFAIVKASLEKSDGQWHDQFGQWLFQLPKPQNEARSEKLPLRIKDEVVSVQFFPDGLKMLPVSILQPRLQQDGTVPNKWSVLASVGQRDVVLGSYTLTQLPANANDDEMDSQLEFEWGLDAARETEAAELVRWLPLQVTVGDRTAVFLQRKAEVPSTAQHVPTWLSLVERKKIPLLNSDAIKALSLPEFKNVRYILHISEKDQPTQVIQFGQTAPATNEPAAVPDADEGQPTTTWRYFPLRRPIQLQEIRPTPDGLGPELMGYGEIGLTLRTDAEAIEILPEVNATVRLPSPSFLQQLPSANLKQQIIELKNDANQFIKIAGQQEQDNTWPRIVDLRQHAMNELNGTIRAYRAQVEHWHTQPLEKIITRNKFSTTFVKDAEKAKTNINNTLRTLETAVKQSQFKEVSYLELRDITGKHPDFNNNTVYSETKLRLSNAVQDAKARFVRARYYEGAIQPFCGLLDELVTATKATVEDSMRNFDDVGRILNEWTTAGKSGEFTIRLLVSSPELPTPGVESGVSVTVYFADSSPHVRTATEVHGAAPPAP